jgi:hypothetical protein
MSLSGTCACQYPRPLRGTRNAAAVRLREFEPSNRAETAQFLESIYRRLLL